MEWLCGVRKFGVQDRCPSSIEPPCSSLIASVHTLTREIGTILKQNTKQPLQIIPGGLTKKLQLLDISVNQSFKNHIREDWEKWMSEGMYKFTATGMRQATHEEVCNWVIRAWRAVKVTSITNGFKKAGITYVLGDSEDGESDVSSDDEQMESSATLDLVHDAHLMDLFNSDTKDEDFDGF